MCPFQVRAGVHPDEVPVGMNRLQSNWKEDI